MNWNNFSFIDLFAGIGGIRLGFESVGGHCVFSSEFDENACKTYEANFGEHPSGDITKILVVSLVKHFLLLEKRRALKMKLVELFSLKLKEF